MPQCRRAIDATNDRIYARPLIAHYTDEHVEGIDENDTPDLCASQVSWTDPVGTTFNLCVTENCWLMRGNTASTLARLGLHGYSTEWAYNKVDTDACPIDSALFSMAYEEN